MSAYSGRDIQNRPADDQLAANLEEPLGHRIPHLYVQACISTDKSQAGILADLPEIFVFRHRLTPS
jgi:hypothetical protein